MIRRYFWLVTLLCASCAGTSGGGASTSDAPAASGSIAKPPAAEASPPAATERLTPTGEPAVAVRLDPDERRLRGIAASGDEAWIVDIIAKCGEPTVGESRIRHLGSRGDLADVVYGKHSFAEVRIADGAVTCTGADKAFDPMAGLNPKAVALLAKLNSWDSEECDVHERPDAYPGRKASGETNGWIDSHKSLLEEIGYPVVWDAKVRRYLFAPGE